MRSVYDFIVEPVGERYDNELKIGDKKLVLNSKIESHKFINNKAKVISVPIAFKTPIKVGDQVIIHHNVFRIYYDMKGRPRKSPNFFKDNIYFIDPSQFYLYHNGEKWNSVDDFCFVKPISIENKYLHQEGNEENTGIVVYSNNSLRGMGVEENSKINFSKDSEYKFVVNNETLYRMRTKDVCTILS